MKNYQNAARNRYVHVVVERYACRRAKAQAPAAKKVSFDDFTCEGGKDMINVIRSSGGNLRRRERERKSCS